MKIAVVTAIWKRPEVFALFAQGIHYLQQNSGHDIIVCVADSERREEEVRGYGFDYVYFADNAALGAKMNAAAVLASSHTPDWYLFLGSDDIVSLNMLRKYSSLFSAGYQYVAVKDHYFYDLETKRGLYWAGYLGDYRDMACGAARALNADAMRQINYKPWYDDQLHNLLDTAFDEKIRPLNLKRQTLSCREDGIFALDIKGGETNMTPFAQWNNSVYLPGEYVTGFVPYLGL